MFRLLSLLCSIFLLLTIPLTAQVDLLDRYVMAIEDADADAKGDECDFLISSCRDSILRQEVALRLYDHYVSSALMGDEAVAIHIYDKWFASGLVAMKSEMDLMNAEVFARFNRSTLPGMEAPVLDLQSADGSTVGIPGKSDRRKVLYFYDIGCATCKIESVLLTKMLDEMGIPLDFFAIYVGEDQDSWREYVSNHFQCGSGDVTVINAWDAGGQADMLVSYGVLQTPKLFLVGRNGEILGRRLTVDALKQLLQLGAIEDELTGRTPVGGHLPDLRLNGNLYRGRKIREMELRLNRFSGKPAYVMLYSESCGRCREELDAVSAAAAAGARVFTVNVDEILATDPELAKSIFDSFDLTELPQIIEVDRKAVVRDRYVSLRTKYLPL